MTLDKQFQSLLGAYFDVSLKEAGQNFEKFPQIFYKQMDDYEKHIILINLQSILQNTTTEEGWQNLSKILPTDMYFEPASALQNIFEALVEHLQSN